VTSTESLCGVCWPEPCVYRSERNNEGDKGTMSTLGDEYPKEQARCRELVRAYRELGPTGRIGALMIEETLRRADEAAAHGDVVAMIGLFQEMKAHA